MDVSAPLQAREAKLRERPLPGHIGIIMDGNGRWAEERGRPRLEGHREGSDSVRAVTRSARRIGVKALTLYAFSAQNWSRPAEEVAGLMDLLREFLESERAEILENKIRLNAVGELGRLPRSVRAPLDDLMQESAAHGGMVLTLALSYGGREELVAAAKLFAERLQAGVLDARTVTNEEFEACLWSANLPAVDLVIRTSGEQRISNFLLWQVAYAELCFVDALWPDFRGEALVECIAKYQGRERRFGLTSAQLPR